MISGAFSREGADRVRPVCAVDGVLLATGQRQGAWAHRVSWRTAGDHVRQPRVVAPDLVRRRPGGADMLAVDLGAALPLFTSPAHADRITDRSPVPEDVVELTIMRPNDDRSRPLGSFVGYELSREFR